MSDEYLRLRHPDEDTKIRLDCTNKRCSRTTPIRKKSDPDTVVRCADCGKKHAVSSLVKIEGSDGDKS